VRSLASKAKLHQLNWKRSKSKSLVIDQNKIEADARFDGKWVLKTNTSLSSEQVALKYKELWQVEQIF
jgi:hypothetical protein